MRLLIAILLFISLQSQAQIVRTHPYYRPTAAPCSPLLLDTYSGAAAAYSLRKLDCDYSGSAIRVRRSSDNTESDIGFTSGGDLDTAALKTFVGTGGSDDGFVVKFYNQGSGGSTYDLTQSTEANQPKIMDNGVIYRYFGTPSPHYDGTDQLLNTSFSITSNTVFAFTVSSKDDAGSNSASRVLSIGLNTSTNDFSNTKGVAIQTYNTGTVYMYSYRNNSFGPTVTAAYATQYLCYTYINGTVLGMALNGGSVSTAATSGTALNSTTISIGAVSDRSAQGFLNGTISEVIIYFTDISASRTGIESNINSYYSIY